MPQWRKLHVKTIDSLDVNAMPDDFTRFMWVILPLGLDSQGRGIDDAAWIKSKLFPLRRDVTLEQVELAMAWYCERGMIQRYTSNDRSYFLATKFTEYQGKTDREAPSRIPGPDLRKTKVSHELVKSKSRPIQDKGPNWSVTDVDSDIEVDSEKHAGAHPAPDEPDALKSLAAIFEQVSGIKLDSIDKKSQGPLYWHPLGLMLKTGNGSAEGELRAAVAHLRQGGMTISSPKSVLNTFNSLHGAHAAPGQTSAAAELRKMGYTDANGKPV